MAVLLGSCTATNAIGDVRHNSEIVTKLNTENDVLVVAVNMQEEEDLNLERIAREAFLEKNRKALKDRIEELSKYVNRTPYVFSGSSTGGWDCSGLTTWFYAGLGVELDHSASKQGKFAGFHVDKPKPGDIVAFKHVNAEKYYHVGIYVGNNKIIHAKKPGTRTEKVELTDNWFSQSEISFIRVIEN